MKRTKKTSQLYYGDIAIMRIPTHSHEVTELLWMLEVYSIVFIALEYLFMTYHISPLLLRQHSICEWRVFSTSCLSATRMYKALLFSSNRSKSHLYLSVISQSTQSFGLYKLCTSVHPPFFLLYFCLVSVTDVWDILVCDVRGILASLLIPPLFELDLDAVFLAHRVERSSSVKLRLK